MRFLLIDRIVQVEPGVRISGIKNVAMSEDVLEYHFPKNPIMPGIMLLEALVQLGGWLEAVSSGFERWLLVSGVKKSSFYGFVLPGDQVEFTLTRSHDPESDLVTCSGVGMVDGKRKIKAEFEGTALALDSIEEVEDQKRFYKILTRELGF